MWVPFVFRASSLILKAASGDGDAFKAIEPRTFPLFDNLAKVVFFAAFTYVILIQVWNLNPAGFIASAGIVGLAVSFAAQDTLSNLFAGVFIIADAPYGVGDFITLDSGERVEVLHIGLRSTRIRLTKMGQLVTIPNADLAAARVENYTEHSSGGPEARRSTSFALPLRSPGSFSPPTCVAEAPEARGTELRNTTT